MTHPTVSPTCEHATERNLNQVLSHCGQPTWAWYPALGGGSMALCREHARRFLSPAFGLTPYTPEATDQ